MDLADCNVSNTLLFLKEVLKLTDLWPNTRRVSGEWSHIWDHTTWKAVKAITLLLQSFSAYFRTYNLRSKFHDITSFCIPVFYMIFEYSNLIGKLLRLKPNIALKILLALHTPPLFIILIPT